MKENCEHKNVGQRISNIWFNINGQREWLARCWDCGKIMTIREEVSNE